MLSLHVSPRTAQLTRRQEWVLLLLALGGSIVIHSPTQLLFTLVPNLLKNLTSQQISALNYFRGFIFLIVTSTLLVIIGRQFVQFIYDTKGKISFDRLFMNSLVASIVLSLLILPTTLGIMGVGYAAMSVDPFSSTDGSYQLYQRLMMPALAYFLQFKDALLYHIFSLIISFCCIFCLQLFFETRKIHLSRLEIVSLSTTCLIATQFQSPGYTDSLVILSALILFAVPMNSLGRISLVIFSLFVHESSVLLFAAVSFLYFNAYEKKLFAAAAFLYGICWIVSFGFDIERVISVRNVGGVGGLQWLLSNPHRELLGILLSYKMIWIFLFIAVYRFPAHLTMFILLLLPGIVATAMAVDTTRLLALGFLPFLFAIEYVRRYGLMPEKNQRYLHVMNIIVPSVYVGLNSGTVFFNGLYQLIYQGVFIK
ncbi:MAG: hypothetical protein HYV29_11385 [Ignavibacteriales bacterium]|nr:hypothetical protein [Ignavibacteriales bacterium]